MKDAEILEYFNKLEDKAIEIARFLNETRKPGWTKDDDIKSICFLFAQSYTSGHFDFEVFETIKELTVRMAHVIIKAEENQT